MRLGPRSVRMTAALFSRRSDDDKNGAALALSIQEQFGQIDIYVFDQILRGNIEDGMCVVDAGCGYGRNLVHLLRQGGGLAAVGCRPISSASN